MVTRSVRGADPDVALGSQHRVAQLQLQLGLEVLAGARRGAAALARAPARLLPEDGLEDRAEVERAVALDVDRGEVAEVERLAARRAARLAPAPHLLGPPLVEAGAERVRAELVVERSALRVGEDLEGGRDLLEALLGRLVPRVDVGVVLAGLLPVGLLDLLRGRGPGDAEDLVEVAVGHARNVTRHGGASMADLDDRLDYHGPMRSLGLALLLAAAPAGRAPGRRRGGGTGGRGGPQPGQRRAAAADADPARRGGPGGAGRAGGGAGRLRAARHRRAPGRAALAPRPVAGGRRGDAAQAGRGPARGGPGGAGTAFRRRFPDEASYRRFLATSELPEEELQSILARGLRVQRFLDNRLGRGARVSDEEVVALAGRAGHGGADRPRSGTRRGPGCRAERAQGQVKQILADLRSRADIRVLMPELREEPAR